MKRAEIFAKSLDDFGAVLNSVLSPATAIKQPDLLHGRGHQLQEVRQALAMRGRHVFVHGLRGVGKTSLAWTAAYLVQSSDGDPLYVQCSPKAGFLDVVHDILKHAFPSDPTEVRRLVEVMGEGRWSFGKMHLSAGLRQTIETGGIPRPQSINDAVELMCFVASRHSKRPVVIVDEFDHLPKEEHIQVDLFIKQLAEEDDAPLKMILCGVGGTLASLFSAHHSTYRYFHPIPLAPLGLEASREIILRAAATLDVEFDETTLWRIPRVSAGFPHFVHLICEKIFWAMFNDADRMSVLQNGRVGMAHYRTGTRDAVYAAHEELKTGYEEAIRKYSTDAELILWAVADGHELQRKIQEMYASYLRIHDQNPNLKRLTPAQFRARVYKLCQESHRSVLRGNKKGWYEFEEKMMRGYARLRAENDGIELFPDHPLLPKNAYRGPSKDRPMEI